jgi:hypothetical protein
MELAEQVIDVALAMDMWVFGGYVRDVIVRRQKKFGDIDLGCSDKKTSVEQFIRVLGTRFDVKEVRSRRFNVATAYGRMSKGIKRVDRFVVNGSLHIDVVVFDGTFSDWCDEESVDFTSNLFFKSWDTELGIRYAPGRFRHMANPVAELVKMTREGVFERIWDATDSHVKPLHVFQVCLRARDLVRRGFTFKGTLISPLMEILVLGYHNVEDRCAEIDEEIEALQTRRSTREVMKCLNRQGTHLPEEIYTKIESAV